MTRFIFALALVIVFSPQLAAADDGHNHGNEESAATGSASPRIQAHSELFELVGIVDKGQMTVYLDRYATNEPVTNARIEFESSADKGVAQVQPDGTYLIKFDALGQPGELPFAFTVIAGADTDLLAGDLAIKDLHEHHDAGPGRPWLRWAGYAAAAVLVLALAFFLARRFATTRRARLNA